MHIARPERSIEADGCEHGLDLGATCFSVVLTVNEQSLLEGAADVPPWIECGGGILVHVLNGAPLASGDGRLNATHDGAIELDLSRGLALNAKQRPPERGLAAPRLPDEAQGFSGSQGQGNASHRLHRQDHWPQPPPSAAEQYHDVSRLERRSDFAWDARGHGRPARRSSASLQLTRRPGGSATSRGVRWLHCA